MKKNKKKQKENKPRNLETMYNELLEEEQEKLHKELEKQKEKNHILVKVLNGFRKLIKSHTTIAKENLTLLSNFNKLMKRNKDILSSFDESDSEANLKIAEEYVAAGRFMAMGFSDMLDDICVKATDTVDKKKKDLVQSLINKKRKRSKNGKNKIRTK
jgi:hypothetical protein